MGINWIIIGIVSVCVIVLFIFLIKRNAKDEKDLTEILDKNEESTINRDDSELKDVE
jgi:uncharacterized membrane protein